MKINCVFLIDKQGKKLYDWTRTNAFLTSTLDSVSYLCEIVISTWNKTYLNELFIYETRKCYEFISMILVCANCIWSVYKKKYCSSFIIYLLLHFVIAASKIFRNLSRLFSTLNENLFNFRGTSFEDTKYKEWNNV